MIEKHKSHKLLQRQNSCYTRPKEALLRKQKSTICLSKQASTVTSEKTNRLTGTVQTLLDRSSGFGLLKNHRNLFIRLQSIHDFEREECEELNFTTNNNNNNNNNNNYNRNVNTEFNSNNTYRPEDLHFEIDSEIAAKIIRKEEFELGRVLGSGGFGSVYLGVFNNQPVAVKIIHKYTKNPAAQLESFKAELQVLKFNHPNIIKTLAATSIEEFEDGAWVVMEYVGHSSLHAIIADPCETLDSDRRLKFSLQIASALAYAHRHRIAHLDLKPANVLISPDDDCKVGDFGCSQMIQLDMGKVSPTGRSALTGTFSYRSPELLRGHAPTFKADLYSYGVTLWQMRSRTSPYGDQNHHVIIFSVVSKGLRPPDPDTTETDPFELSYKDLYAQCWAADPLDRPSAQELVDVFTVWKDNM